MLIFILALINSSSNLMDIIRSFKKHDIIQSNTMIPLPSTLGITTTYIHIHKKPNPIFKIYSMKFLRIIHWMTIINLSFPLENQDFIISPAKKNWQVANHLVLYESVLLKKQHTLIHMMTRSIPNIKKSKKKSGSTFIIVVQTRSATIIIAE